MKKELQETNNKNQNASDHVNQQFKIIETLNSKIDEQNSIIAELNNTLKEKESINDNLNINDYLNKVENISNEFNETQQKLI